MRAGITQLLEFGIGWNAEFDAVDNILVIAEVAEAYQRIVHAEASSFSEA